MRPEHPKTPEEWQDYEGGYGGGRQRAEEFAEEGFGETGWGDGRSRTTAAARPAEQGRQDYPHGVKPANEAGPSDKWQEEFTRQNADKYGQGGGQPIKPRGTSQSQGGYEDREQSLGDTRDISPRGAYGQRETDRHEAEKKDSPE